MIARRGGYTLVEVLGYAALLLVILNLSASVFIGTHRLYTLGALAIERNELIEQVEQDFREAVHASSESAASVSGLPGKPVELALVSKPSKDITRYRLWRRDDDGRLYFEQYDATATKKFSLVSRKVYPVALKALALSVMRDPAAPVIQLDLTVDNKSTPHSVPKINRFVAALGVP